VVEAAMHLFASRSSETVTVAEIAKEAGMTSAAVYYHYASKDDILLEGLHDFGELLVAEVVRLQRQVSRNRMPVAELLSHVLEWLAEHRDAATVYFVGSAGLTLPVEAQRRDIRGELVTALTKAARSGRSGVPAGEAAVIGVALLSLIDTAATAWLTNDESMTALGDEEFLVEVTRLAERIVG
jgi:AcrR family transcriptional regulator